MQRTTLDELEWIHDCVLLSILYDTSSDSGQSIRVTMRCPADFGYAPWEGKELMLTAIDVAMSNQALFAVAGQETIDAIRPGVSAAVRERTIEAKRMGVCFPSLEFTISLHSGSSVEVICRDLRIGVGTTP